MIGKMMKVILRDQWMENSLVHVERNLSKEKHLFFTGKDVRFGWKKKQMKNLMKVFLLFDYN